MRSNKPARLGIRTLITLPFPGQVPWCHLDVFPRFQNQLSKFGDFAVKVSAMTVTYGRAVKPPFGVTSANFDICFPSLAKHIQIKERLLELQNQAIGLSQLSAMSTAPPTIAFPNASQVSRLSTALQAQKAALITGAV